MSINILSKCSTYSRNFIACGLLFIASVVHALSISQTSNASQEETKIPSKNIEVIAVEGEYSLLYFRQQMQQAELDFYDAYNALADNAEFKIRCRTEQRTGSRLRYKSCLPQFVLTRMTQETQDAMLNGTTPPSLKEIEFAVKKEREESIKYTEKLVIENPTLLEKLMALNEKQATYESEKLSRK